MPGPYPRPSHTSGFNDGSSTDATVLMGELETSVEELEGSVATPVPNAAQALTNLGAESSAHASATFQSVYKPEAYGAKRDGVTDDSTAIQAAITAAAAAGGVCYLSPGTYIVGAQLVLTGTAYTVAGAGAGSVLKQAAGSNLNQVILLSACSQVTLRDFTIDGNSTAQTSGNGRGVTNYNGTDLRTLALTITNTRGEAIESDMVPTADCRWLIADCNIHDTGSRAIFLNTTGKVTIRNCDLRSPATLEVVMAITCAQVIFEGNTVYGGTGRQVVLDACPSSVVTGNTLDQPPDDGISIQSSSLVTVTGNTVIGKAGNIGPGITVWGSTTFTTVTGNTVTGCDIGIAVDGGTGAGQNADLVIADNVVTANATGISVDAAGGGTNNRVLIRGNIANANTAYGIHLLGASSDTKVNGNYAMNNTTANVLDSSTGTGNDITGNFTT